MFRDGVQDRFGLGAPQQQHTFQLAKALLDFAIVSDPDEMIDGVNNARLAATHVLKRLDTAEQAGDLPAFGSPVGHAHQRALQANFFEEFAYNAIAKSLCWHEAKHAWKRSNTKIAGRPQQRCKYSHATANGNDVVKPKVLANLAACSTRTVCCAKRRLLAMESDTTCSKLVCKMY